MERSREIAIKAEVKEVPRPTKYDRQQFNNKPIDESTGATSVEIQSFQKYIEIRPWTSERF